MNVTNEEDYLFAFKDTVRSVVESLHPVSETAREDMRASGMVGLLKAIRSYDSSKGVFQPYIRARIRGEILDDLRTADWLPRHARKSPGAPQRVDLEYADHVPDPGALPSHAAVQREVIDSIATLPEMLQRIIFLHYFRGETFRTIAQEFQLTGSRIGQLHAEGLRLLRKAVCE
jgi:RNA polymerase sigma factor (sigma-70 family)